MKKGTRVKVNNYKYSSIEKGTLYGTVYRMVKSNNKEKHING